ncbi:hypothetical protein LOAG_06573 [Loa loa]|uniref:Uncharacterized protein n=1 Tax=Loa loa TaxID=7209 RepID=A0A1I7VP32_LOALO|nr:hypothetical protein LOAG_06573 [Loa loa]EFO21911.2 hypothetical protein LOAG_06573 [Loa loa]
MSVLERLIVSVSSESNAMYNFRMTDSETESFHSAVDSLSDREDANSNDSSLKIGKFDERRKVDATEDNRHEFGETHEMPNTRILEVLSSNRKKQMYQNLSSSEEPATCKFIPARQNDDCVAVDEAHFDPERKIISTQESGISDLASRKILNSQTFEYPTSQHNWMGIGKVSSSGNYSESDKIFRKDEELFGMNRFEDEDERKVGINSYKMSRKENKASECGLVSRVIDNVDNVSVAEEIEERSEEKTDIDHDGWDDWEMQYSRRDGNDSGILDENREPPRMLASDEEDRIIANSKSEARQKKEEIKTSKSFWDWTEFGDVVTAVGEGLTNISSVVESGLGLPAPEELVRNQPVERRVNDSAVAAKETEEVASSSIKSYGKLFAGFGANVVTGSLDVLEALGKKTFEKLTIPEQGSEKRRFIFEPERGQNLSEVLRELRESRAEETTFESNCITKRELTFIDFFERFSGMLHLEGLEMLSKNYLRKIPSQRKSKVNEIFAEDLANTLEEYQDNEQENFLQNFKEILLAIALPYNGSGLMDAYRRCQERLEKLSDSSDQIFEVFLECLADFTAQSVQSIHKLGQLMLITATTVKQEPFSEFHCLLGRQISFFSNQFAQHISAVDAPSEEIEELVTAVFLAAGDSFSYVQQSFRLLRPLLIL